MKHSFLIIFLIGLSFHFTLKADDFPKVIEENKVYTYFDTQPTSVIYHHPYFYFFDGTEVHNEKTYHRYWEYFQSFFGSFGTYEKKMIGLIREDNGKIFLFTPPEIWGIQSYSERQANIEEVLLYDFTIPEGESYMMRYNYAPYLCKPPLGEEEVDDINKVIYKEYRVILKSKDTVSINGQKRKRYQFVINASDIVTFIEGFGPTLGNLAYPCFDMERPTDASSPQEFFSVFDAESKELVYGFETHFKVFSDGGSFKNLLSEGLDFEYTKRKTGGDRFSADSKGNSLHYRIGSQIKIGDYQCFQVDRYEGEYSPNADTYPAAYMREDRGRLIMLPGILPVCLSEFAFEYMTEYDDITYHIYSTEYVLYDLNTGDLRDEVIVDGEKRTHIKVGDTHIIEGLGIVSNGVLPFRGGEHAKKNGYEYVLNCIRDADGNVVFSRDMLSGVEEISTGEESVSKPQYFDLTGRRVTSPDKGVYIVKDSRGVRKVIL